MISITSRSWCFFAHFSPPLSLNSPHDQVQPDTQVSNPRQPVHQTWFEDCKIIGTKDKKNNGIGWEQTTTDQTTTESTTAKTKTTDPTLSGRTTTVLHSVKQFVSHREGRSISSWCSPVNYNFWISSPRHHVCRSICGQSNWRLQGNCQPSSVHLESQKEHVGLREGATTGSRKCHHKWALVASAILTWVLKAHPIS